MPLTAEENIYAADNWRKMAEDLDLDAETINEFNQRQGKEAAIFLVCHGYSIKDIRRVIHEKNEQK